MCELTGGFYYAATEAVPRPEALRQLADAWAAYTLSSGSVRFADLGGMVRDPAARTSHEVDVAALDADGRVLAVGEVKWGKRMDLGHLARLEKIADVLGSRGQRPRVLALFSGTGFAHELAEAAATSGGRVQLIGLDRLYQGS